MAVQNKYQRGFVLNTSNIHLNYTADLCLASCVSWGP